MSSYEKKFGGKVVRLVISNPSYCPDNKEYLEKKHIRYCCRKEGDNYTFYLFGTAGDIGPATRRTQSRYNRLFVTVVLYTTLKYDKFLRMFGDCDENDTVPGYSSCLMAQLVDAVKREVIVQELSKPLVPYELLSEDDIEHDIGQTDYNTY